MILAMASEAGQKKIDINKVKTTVGPPLLAIRPHLWQIWGGVRTPGPPPPLWICACTLYDDPFMFTFVVFY